MTVRAATLVMVMYAPEPKVPGFALAFAAGCLPSSAHGFRSDTWPFRGVEAIWVAVAARRHVASRSS